MPRKTKTVTRGSRAIMLFSAALRSGDSPFVPLGGRHEQDIEMSLSWGGGGVLFLLVLVVPFLIPVNQFPPRD